MTNFENIRLIALDLDDTTLRSDGSLSSQTKKAIPDIAYIRLGGCTS